MFLLLPKRSKVGLKLGFIWHHNKNGFVPYLQSEKYDNKKCLYQEIHRWRYFSFFLAGEGGGVIFVWSDWYCRTKMKLCSLLVTCPETRQNMPRSVFFIFYIETWALSHSHSLPPSLSVSHWFFSPDTFIFLHRASLVHNQKLGWFSKKRPAFLLLSSDVIVAWCFLPIYLLP